MTSGGGWRLRLVEQALKQQIDRIRGTERDRSFRRHRGEKAGVLQIAQHATGSALGESGELFQHLLPAKALKEIAAAAKDLSLTWTTAAKIEAAYPEAAEPIDPSLPRFTFVLLDRHELPEFRPAGRRASAPAPREPQLHDGVDGGRVIKPGRRRSALRPTECGRAFVGSTIVRSLAPRAGAGRT
jgi:hypothetical protein